MAINIYKHCDSASAGGGDGSTWALAGANAAYTEAELEVFLEGAVVAGDIIFVKDGVYTFDSDYDFTLRDGTAVSPIAIIGVKAGTINVGANVVYDDWARDAADRPFFDGVTFVFRTSDYNIIRNIDFQSAAAQTVYLEISDLVENCKFDNDFGASGARYALYTVSFPRVINCEFVTANCRGVNLSMGGIVLYNYFHDIPDGVNGWAIYMAGDNRSIAFNIFDNCAIGINSPNRDQILALNNTFYGCGVAISETTGFNWVAINNLLEGCTADGFLWTTQTDSNFFWENHGDDARNVDMWDLVDTTTIYQDYEVTAGDPLFNLPLFTFPATSPCQDTGMSIELGV